MLSRMGIPLDLYHSGAATLGVPQARAPRPGAGEVRPGISLASGFVWSVWLLLTVGTAAFIARYGSNVPSWDDWDMVPTLTGNQPVTLEWLWSQHNEHRVPVPRLLLLGLHALVGVDFRTPMYFNLFAVALLAATMIVAAGRLRGRVLWTDAFFPIVLLHWGQAANLLWGWQLQFYASAILSGIILVLLLGTEPKVRRRTGIAIGVCVVLLPLCGANGLGLVPALAVWMLYAGILRWNSGGRGNRATGAVFGGFGAAALLLTGLYFVGYESVPWHPKSSGPLATLSTSVKFLSVGLGPAVRHVWPFSGLLTLAAMAASAGLAALAWMRIPTERARAAGLLFFLGAMTSLALGLGLGRDGFETRYVTLALPVWCCMYFIVSLYAPARVNAKARTALVVAAILVLVPNTRFGLGYAQDLRRELRSFERDLAAGIPLYQLVKRYDPYLHPHQDVVTEYLTMLKQADVAPYRSLRLNPPLREIRVPLAPAAAQAVNWENGTAHVTGSQPHIDFRLADERHVTGIRLQYTYHTGDGMIPLVGLFWKSDGDEFSDARYKKYSPTGDHANWERGTWNRIDEPVTTMTAWVDETVGAIRIVPGHKGGTFRLHELVLLVANEAERPSTGGAPAAAQPIFPDRDR